jgi:hypothetical protein
MQVGGSLLEQHRPALVAAVALFCKVLLAQALFAPHLAAHLQVQLIFLGQ